MRHQASLWLALLSSVTSCFYHCLVCLSLRCELETRAHRRLSVHDPTNAWLLQPLCSPTDQRTSAGPALSTSPAYYAGPAPPCAPYVTQPRATARSSLLPGSARLHSSRPHHELCASPHPDHPSPCIHPEHRPYAADPYTHDQSECDWQREIHLGGRWSYGAHWVDYNTAMVTGL